MAAFAWLLALAAAAAAAAPGASPFCRELRHLCESLDAGDDDARAVCARGCPAPRRLRAAT